MDRREFLGKALGLTVVSAVTPGILTCACDAFAKGSAPLSFSEFTIDLNTTQFSPLKQIGKSVKIGTPTSLIIIRVDATTFSVLSSICTHQNEVTVGAYNATTGVMTCPRHGSQFDEFGAVAKGPATQDLARYTAVFDGDHKVIISDTLADVEMEALSITTIVNIYPNPFSSGTNIVLKLKEQTSIDLGIFDIDGRKHASVFEGKLSAGEHTLVFDGSSLAAGSYFCRLSTPSGSIVRQIHIER